MAALHTHLEACHGTFAVRTSVAACYAGVGKHPPEPQRVLYMEPRSTPGLIWRMVLRGGRLPARRYLAQTCLSSTESGNIAFFVRYLQHNRRKDRIHVCSCPRLVCHHRHRTKTLHTAMVDTLVSGRVQAKESS
jgi:hypothetical protein